MLPDSFINKIKESRIEKSDKVIHCAYSVKFDLNFK